jgi:hypothetical protein
MDFQRDLRFPGMVIWEEKDDPADFAPFARALADYRVRYIILHEQYIDHAPELRDRIVRLIEDPATWAGQDAVRPPTLAFADRTLRAWRVEPARD